MHFLLAKYTFFLHSLLINLKVKDRIRAVLNLNGFSFRDVERVGGFGGSILSNLLKSDSNRIFKESTARVAIVLDIPIVFMLRDKPSYLERQQYDYLEFRELGEKISFAELQGTLIRPKSRGIFPYEIQFEKDVNLPKEIQDLFQFCRVDLQKTFYSVEFYIKSYLDIDVKLVEMLVRMFGCKVYRVIISTPILRDTYKLSIIGSYIEEQYKDAEKFADELLKYYHGTQLYPDYFDFEIESVVPN